MHSSVVLRSRVSGFLRQPKGSKYHYSRSIVGVWAPKVYTIAWTLNPKPKPFGQGLVEWGRLDLRFFVQRGLGSVWGGGVEVAFGVAICSSGVL